MRDDRELFRISDPEKGGSNRFVWISFGATVALLAVLTWIGWPLQTEEAPAGIVSFELAGSPERALAMVGSWDEDGRGWAAMSLAVDYLFLIAYASWLWSALRSLATRLGDRGAAHARRLASAMWLAAGLDAVENAALAMVLVSSMSPDDAAGTGIEPAWPALAFACASVKFALVGAALVVLAWGLVNRRAERR